LAASTSQFAHPRGPRGWLVGAVMAIENRQRNEMALAVLAAQTGRHNAATPIQRAETALAGQGDHVMATQIPANSAPKPSGLPSWLPLFNRLVMVLQRLGFVVGAMHVLTIPGRQSGIPRSTPVSLMTVNGQRYIVAGLDDADWVLNARATGRGVLHRGRTEEHISLTEIPVEERAPILREFPRLVPHGVPFFTRIYGVTADPEQFAALAGRCPVFRVETR
jgi:hypothetical protein